MATSLAIVRTRSLRKWGFHRAGERRFPAAARHCCSTFSGLAAVVGGVLGYLLIGSFEQGLPYLLVLASSSFIYVSVADLLPQLQQRPAWRETLAQVAWLAAALSVAFGISQLLHIWRSLTLACVAR